MKSEKESIRPQLLEIAATLEQLNKQLFLAISNNQTETVIVLQELRKALLVETVQIRAGTWQNTR